MFKRENIPNFLSVYRLLSFPVMLLFIYWRMESYFVSLLIIGLISDWLDGFLARRYQWQSELGSKLDTYADILMNIAAVIGIYYFKWDEIKDASWIIYLFFSLYILFHILAIIKYKTLPSFHTYAFKITAYLQGIFIGVLFVFGYFQWLFIFVMGFSILTQIEELILLFKLKKPIPNVKGLYYLFKKKQIK